MQAEGEETEKIMQAEAAGTEKIIIRTEAVEK